MKQKCFNNPNEVNYDRMREDRLKAGLDQEACADVLGISPSTISGWESGKRTPKINHLVRYAELLNQDPERYVEGEAVLQILSYQAKTRVIKDYASIK